jgi:cytochrome P450
LSRADHAPPLHGVRLPTPRLGWPLVQALRRDPLGTWRDIHRAGDVVQARVLGREFHFVFHPAMVRAALADQDEAISKEEQQIRVFQIGQGLNVLTSEGADWKRQRRILNPAFSARKVAGYMALMTQALAQVNAESLPVGPGHSVQVDAHAYTARLTMDVILRVLFGERMDPGRLQAVSDAIHQLEVQGMRMIFWPWIPPDWMPYPGRRATWAARDLLRQLVRGHIESRRALGGTPEAGRTDLLHMMLQAQDEVPAPDKDRHLSPGEVEDNCLALFLAGYDTSATALTWWMGFMAEHPEAAERARDEVRAAWGLQGLPVAPAPEHLSRMPWLEATLKETLRLRPPIPAPFMRQVRRDVNLLGYRVPAGDCISLPVWEVQRDARWFPEPLAFRPERFMPGAPEIPRGAWLPFGSGPHVCLGQHFAMVEMQLIAAALLAGYRWRLPAGRVLPAPRLDIVLKPETLLQLDVEALAAPG